MYMLFRERAEEARQLELNIREQVVCVECLCRRRAEDQKRKRVHVGQKWFTIIETTWLIPALVLKPWPRIYLPYLQVHRVDLARQFVPHRKQRFDRHAVH